MHFRKANTEPSMHFRKANTEQSVHFKKANTESFVHFREANTEPSVPWRLTSYVNFPLDEMSVQRFSHKICSCNRLQYDVVIELSKQVAIFWSFCMVIYTGPSTKQQIAKRFFTLILQIESCPKYDILHWKWPNWLSKHNCCSASWCYFENMKKKTNWNRM